MGGSKGDRKSYKATSSAKAAEALASKGAAVGFGGFSGVKPVAGFGFGAPAVAAGAAAGPSAGDVLELSAQLDVELAQCIRHLSKRDTITKMKALQNLKELIPQKSPADLALLLQPWTYQFKRLLLDPAKSVRAEAAAIMAAIGSSVGKALLPQLKKLLGPWYLACFDPYPDAAAAAKKSLLEVFPGRKQADVLLYCRTEVLDHIITCLNSTPQSLGDLQKDSTEELEERHERINAAALAAAAALLTSLQQADPATSATSATSAESLQEDPLQDTLGKLQEALQAGGFWKKQLGSKSMIVRRAAYGFVKGLTAVAPQLLSSCQQQAAPLVLGALQDKEPSNHPALWEMLLSFISCQRPACWDVINMPKAFNPRLLAFLRHGCHGSAASSLPALLPLITLLPSSVLVLQPVLLLDSILQALWSGLHHLAGNQSGRAATGAAYQEVVNWALKNAATLAATSGPATSAALAGGSGNSAAMKQYCEQLLVQGHFSHVADLAAAGKAPQLELALESAWRELLAFVLGFGAAAAIAGGCGSEVSAVFQRCMEAQSATWKLLSRCLQGLDPGVIQKVLVAADDRYDMAAALTCPRPWQHHLLHWALLLAHTAQLPGKASKAQRRLTQALRDIPDLVSELLDRVVDLIGLSSSKKAAAPSASALPDADLSSTSSAVQQVAAPVPPVLSAAAQAQLSAKLQQIGSAAHHNKQQWDLATALANIELPTGHHSWRLLAAAVYRAVLLLLPASARLWFSDLRDRSKVAAVEAYTTKFESPALLAAEFAAIKRDAAGSSGEVGGSCSFRVRASPAAREVTAVLEIEDGATLELQVKLPAVAPLKAAEVECRNKNQGILDAIGMWKANLDQEFAGVQPCLICYSVISAANGQLPRLSCKQCSVSFHPACLYKWFRSSGKSTCPHCQAPW
eukprot:gene10671-10830_t